MKTLYQKFVKLFFYKLKLDDQKKELLKDSTLNQKWWIGDDIVYRKEYALKS